MSDEKNPGTKAPFTFQIDSTTLKPARFQLPESSYTVGLDVGFSRGRADASFWTWMRSVMKAAKAPAEGEPTLMTVEELTRIDDIRSRAAMVHDGVEITEEELEFLRGLYRAGKLVVTVRSEAFPTDDAEVVALEVEPFKLPE